MVFECNSPQTRLDGQVGVREEFKVLESAWVQIPLSSCVNQSSDLNEYMIVTLITRGGCMLVKVHKMDDWSQAID